MVVRKRSYACAEGFCPRSSTEDTPTSCRPGQRVTTPARGEGRHRAPKRARAVVDEAYLAWPTVMRILTSRTWKAASAVATSSGSGSTSTLRRPCVACATRAPTRSCWSSHGPSCSPTSPTARAWRRAERLTPPTRPGSTLLTFAGDQLSERPRVHPQEILGQDSELAVAWGVKDRVRADRRPGHDLVPAALGPAQVRRARYPPARARQPHALLARVAAGAPHPLPNEGQERTAQRART